MFNIIKCRLINTDVFEDNEYLDLYVELIVKNLSTKKVSFSTQCHHIIPRYYYKDLNIELDDSDDNVVNFLYKDHILAHYYLAMCSKSGEHKYKNLCGIRRIIRGFNHREDEKKLLLSLPEIQQCYEASKHDLYDLHSLSDETKMKISNAIKGRISIRNSDDTKQKYVYQEELQTYLDSGWVIGHNKQTEESKNKISTNNTGRIAVNKDGIEKHIKPDDLDKFLNDGWIRGSIYKHISLKGRKAIHKDGTIKYVCSDELDSFLNEGWLIGTGIDSGDAVRKYWATHEHIRGRKSSIIGKVAIHKNGSIKYVLPNELNYYLSNDWIKGTGVKSLSVSGRIWITNGEIEKYIYPEELSDYINSGWTRGRNYKRKLNK